MKRYKISGKIFNQLINLNEKYHVLPLDLETPHNLLEVDGFFDIALKLDIEPKDRFFLEYAATLCKLCERLRYNDKDAVDLENNARFARYEYEKKIFAYHNTVIYTD